MESPPPDPRLLRRFRLVLGFFIVALVASGATAFFVAPGIERLTGLLGFDPAATGAGRTGLEGWLLTVRDGLRDAGARYPWMAYGTDWLAFGHIVIALFFIAPLRDPAGCAWVLKTGLVACALAVALAFTVGPIRGIPLGWRCVDASFGVFGAVPLLYCLRLERRMRAPAGI